MKSNWTIRIWGFVPYVDILLGLGARGGEHEGVFGSATAASAEEVTT